MGVAIAMTEILSKMKIYESAKTSNINGSLGLPGKESDHLAPYYQRLL